MELEERDKNLYITEPNRQRLESILEYAQTSNAQQRENLARLMEDLDRANVVESCDIPPDVVTINSKVQLRDLDSGTEITFTLVYPTGADASQDRISVLAPIGSAVLGYRSGNVIEWNVPAGKRRFKIEKILYQPEANGDFDR
ncbi:MAG: nucleoside diphosphate kinase regulator [Thermodesulfobacteriota bacterium]